MNRRFAIVVSAVFTLGFLEMQPTVASAAGRNGMQTVRGTVVGVQFLPAGKQGSILVTAAIPQRAFAGAATREYQVDATTVFSLARNGQRVPANFSAVRNGSHVSIVTNGQTAKSVTVTMPSTRRTTGWNFGMARYYPRHFSNYHRTPYRSHYHSYVYRPHYYRPPMHMHHRAPSPPAVRHHAPSPHHHAHRR